MKPDDLVEGYVLQRTVHECQKRTIWEALAVYNRQKVILSATRLSQKWNLGAVKAHIKAQQLADKL
jgi:hypothetical protein